MATKGCCGNDGCSCIIKAGTGMRVEGSGSLHDPYMIYNAAPALIDTLRVRDTTTVNLQVLGTGTAEDPMILQADAAVTVAGLSDVVDPAGAVAGDVLMFVEDAQGGHWEFRPPPPTPAGAVNATEGITGIGSAANPLRVALSGEWGVAPLNNLGPDSTTGLPIYVDSAGEIRAQIPTNVTTSWDSILNKPTAFTPADHSHTWESITERPTIWPVSAGGTGGNTKALGRAGLGLHVQQAAPTGATVGDLWFW